MTFSQGQFKKCVWLVSLVIGYCVAITTGNSTSHKLPTCSPSSCEMCQNYSTTLNLTMNFSVNACDDFYGHVCSQLATTYYLSSYERIKRDSMMHHATNTILQLAFEKQKTNQKSFNSKALQFTTDLYRECVDVSSRERVGMRPIAQLLGQVLGGGEQRWRTLFGEPKPFFAFINHPDNESIDYYSQSSEDEFTKYWTVWKSTHQNMSKAEEKHPDPPNVEQWMDSFVETALLDVKSSILEIDYHKSNWGGYMKIVIKFIEPSYIFNSSNSSMDKFGLYRELKSKIAFYFDINHPNDHQMNSSSLTDVIFEIIDFKLKYAQLIRGIKCGRDDDRYDECFHNDYIRLAELKHNYTFDWTLLVDKFANKLAGHSSYRINQTKEYDVTIRPLAKLFGPLTKLIARTPIRVLQNVMALDILDNDNIKLLFKSLNVPQRIDTKEVQSARLWNVFVGNEMIFNVFELLYNRIYYDYLQGEKLKSAEKRANEMLRNLKKTLKLNNLLSVSEHGETKQQTLDRLDAIKLVITQPDWIFDDDLLDQTFFADGTALQYRLVKGNYAATSFNLIRSMRMLKFRMISVKDHPWKYISNRKYNFVRSNSPRLTPKPNTIEIRRERLLKEVFDSPIGLAYGSIGIEMAQKMYRELGNKWNSIDQLMAKNSSQCFIQLYDEAFKSGYLINEHDKSLTNETATLKANLLDNAAVRLAYEAFNKHLNQLESGSQCNSRIPFLERFTQQKLFFIAYAKNYCPLGHLYAREFYQHGNGFNETLFIYRVNTTLSNLDQFARAFNCPVGSRMNPQNKCQL